MDNFEIELSSFQPKQKHPFWTQNPQI